ncbi:hypothetical protein [Ruicaihuangia caeni]
MNLPTRRVAVRKCCRDFNRAIELDAAELNAQQAHDIESNNTKE